MSNINCTHIITFRSKFEKFIKCDVERDVFLEAFEKFLNLDADSAFDMLWRLECFPGTEILQKIGLYDGISSELVDVLKSELRHQYEEHCSKISYNNLPDVKEEVQRAYNVLNGRTNAIVATVVYQHCRSSLYLGGNTIYRILCLLSNKKEQNFCGGLKELNFKYWEVQYLKPYHELVHDLLKAMSEAYNEQQNDIHNSPFANLVNRVQFEDTDDISDLPFSFSESDSDTKNQETDEHPIEITENDEVHLRTEPFAKNQSKENPSFTPITPENVLNAKDVFSSFVIHHDFACLGQLSKLGYDLNQVLAKENAIYKFLAAADAL